jgi:hypothetical protein
MPPMTGYESDDEWERRTNANYGQEWRQGVMLFGMVAGAIITFAVVFYNTHGMPMGKVRLLAGIGAFVGIWGGAFIGWCVGYLLDESINPRTRRKRGEARVRIRGRGKKRRVDMD